MERGETALEVEDLRVAFISESEELCAVDGVSFGLHCGRTLALVGESGSGKSVTALALMGLVDPPGQITGGSVRYAGVELTDASAAQMARLRGDRIAMIFQEPMTALNPVMSIGAQVAESMWAHHLADRRAARVRAIELLGEVGIPGAHDLYGAFPDQLSGGMRQRVVIAMALACEPDIVIADEPTTALDVTIQAQILTLLRHLQRQHNMALLFITHDLSLLPAIADDVAVMYAGRIVERASREHFLQRPQHPYSAALLASLPNDATTRRRLDSIPGAVPSLRAVPSGCAFRVRCKSAAEHCAAVRPHLEDGVACFFPEGAA